MKTILSSLLALGLHAGTANARTLFDDLRDAAPRSSVFDDLRNAAPKSVFDQLRDAAPRSDGVFGSLQNGAP